VLANEPSCDWIVAAGDDTFPDPNKRANEIAAECSEHFLRQSFKFAMRGTDADDSFAAVPEHLTLNEGKFQALLGSGNARILPATTFGVMQPTGDSWSCPVRGVKLIEFIAGSPWLGREWCLRANKGAGPLWPGFFHMWADETLQIVAKQLGVFLQRPDLTHHHDHWGRPRLGERIGQLSRMPEFLKRANSPAQTSLDKAEFERLKAGGFQECYPL
jgi:hypothetical protein